MVVFWSTPRHVKLAKIVAIVLTVLFLILPICNWSFKWTPPIENQWTFSIGIIVGSILEVILITIVILECKCLILVALIILAVNIVIFTLAANFFVLIFAISSMTTLKKAYDIKDEYDALLNTIILEIGLAFVWILLFFRYYAVLTVYRWTKLPRIAASGPKITVHNIQ